ncbi:hypothetical protein ACQRWP_33120 [Micromonospora trifolii]
MNDAPARALACASSRARSAWSVCPVAEPVAPDAAARATSSIEVRP